MPDPHPDPHPVAARAIQVALSKLGQKEQGGPNQGPIVEWSAEPWTSRHPGPTDWAKWCAFFVSTCYLEAFAGEPRGLLHQDPPLEGDGPDPGAPREEGPGSAAAAPGAARRGSAPGRPAGPPGSAAAPGRPAAPARPAPRGPQPVGPPAGPGRRRPRERGGRHPVLAAPAGARRGPRPLWPRWCTGARGLLHPQTGFDPRARPSVTREELLRNLRAASADVAAWPPWKMSPDVAAEIAALNTQPERAMSPDAPRPPADHRVRLADGSLWDPWCPPGLPEEPAPPFSTFAHAAARLCRYGGHVDRFISVGEHSLWVTVRACYGSSTIDRE